MYFAARTTIDLETLYLSLIYWRIGNSIKGGYTSAAQLRTNNLPEGCAYLRSAKLLWRIYARRDDRDVVSNLPKSLDQIREPDLHAANMTERTRLDEDSNLLLLLD